VERNSARIVPLTAEILAGLPGIIREADREEIESATGLPIVQALARLPLGKTSSAIVLADKVLAIFGDQPHDPGAGIGVPWLISTVFIEQHPRQFLRVCRPAVRRMLEQHRMLVNYVDKRNTAAIRWLGWLGFTFGTAVPYGAEGRDFLFFNMIRGD
jgi:hypothetical protein